MAEKMKKKNKASDVGFKVGKINLRGLFKGIEKLIDLAVNFIEPVREIKKQGDIDLSHLFAKDASRKGMKGIYGLSIWSDVGGKPVIDTFGNIQKTPEGLVVKEDREPLTEVFDEENEIIIIAEIPGVNNEGIVVNLKGDMLEISAAGKNRRYYKNILLPVKVKPKTLTYSYKNGILESKIKKKSAFLN